METNEIFMTVYLKTIMRSTNGILTIFNITWQKFFKDCNLCYYCKELTSTLVMVTFLIFFIDIYAYNLDQWSTVGY